MSGCSTSASAEPQDQSQCTDLADLSNVSKTCDHSPLQDGNETDEGKIQVDGNANGDVPVEEDEEEDVDFNPFLKESNSLEASSSLSSEVEDLEMDVAHSRGKHSAPFDNKSKKIDGDILKDCHNGGNVESVEEVVMQNTVSESAYVIAMNDESALITQSENGSLFDKENRQTSPTDACNATHSRKTMVDLDTEDAICMRTRARYSLASFTLDELETFLQESDDEDDLQNVDDEAEYRKFLAAVRGDDDSQNLHENANADDEDEENDADFELELEEALESEPEEVEERRMSKRNRCRKASFERSKKLSEQLSRPLRPLLPFGSFPAFDGKNLAPNISPYSIPPVNNGYSYGFTPHQIGQLYCLIHEHVQLLLQVFSMCVLEPGKSQIASEVKGLVVQMHNKYEQALTWRRVPYPSFCFFPPYIHPSVSDRPHKILPSNGNDISAQQNFPSGSNGALHSDTSSMHNERHNYLPDEQGNSSQTPERTSWVPYMCGPVVSVMDVAPVRLIDNYIDDVSSAVRSYEKYQIQLGFEGHCQKEPLFPPRNFLCSAESDGQGEVETHPPDSGEMLSHSSNNQRPKKTMAASLLEKAKNQTIALVHKEIARLAQRFMPLFNPALYPHKPPPAPIANRVLFTDAEDELLALGLMEYNTDWKAIQQRFLPCKSRHQIFVRQKNRASSKAPENPIKAVRRIKNSPLTSEEIARIKVGLKKFKLDWISVWRFLVPYRDPSLLPRQWRIASGTQKSYKSDASKKAKRQLNESRRKSTKPSPSTWHSSSEKEGDSTDNAIEEANSGDNRMDKEDEAYVHEAFLSDWMPENNVFSIFPACMATGEVPQAREQYNSSVFGDIQPPMFFMSPAASRSSNSQVVLQPYRSREPNAARLVKLAPDLPPVNLPPSVRVMSQSAFKSSHTGASSKILGTYSKTAGMVVDNGDPHTRSILDSSMKSGPSRNYSVISASSQYPNHLNVTTDKSVADRSDSDLQMHPLLFQAPQDGDLRYYPSNTSPSRSFSFFSGNQPQLSPSLFHNPRHIRDAVNYLSKSSKPPERNATSSSVDFHPLLQRTDNVDADSVATRPAGRLISNAESRQKCASIRNPPASTSKPSPDGKVNKLDLNIHLSSASKNQDSAEGRNVILRNSGRSVGAPSSKVIESESRKDSGRKRDSAPDRIVCELDSDDVPGVTSRNEGRWEASDKIQNKSLPKKIIMEQEELSDSDEEFGDDVEFECEEMADSDGDSTSDSDQVVDLPSEEARLDGTDADIDDVPVLGSDRSDYTSITCSTSDRRPFGLLFMEKGVNINPNTSSLNLNSCLSVSPYSNPKNAGASFEFGPFGTIGISRENHHLVDSKESIRHVKPATVNIQKRIKDGETDLLGGGELLRKRVCRSNSNSSVADVCVEENSSSHMEMIAENVKNGCTDKI